MVEIDGVEYLTIHEVCDILEVKPATIYAYVSRGILPSYKQGIKRQRLYRADDIRRLITLRPSVTESPVPTPSVPTTSEPSPEQPVPAPLIPSPETTFLPDAEGWIGER
jgi:excisionase family DNA binding protein